MGHRNAPLTPEGRLRLVLRIDEGRPIAHVAKEAGVSRQRLGEWYGRWVELGEAGLEDRSSRPHTSPNHSSPELEQIVVAYRKATRKGPKRISGDLAKEGVSVSPATVHRILQRHDLSRRSDIDPSGNPMRKPKAIRYEMSEPGQRVHIDVKKVGKIPEGGGWRMHGRGTDAAKASRTVKNVRPGYTYLHAAVDAMTRLAYVECLENEQAVTAVAFLERALIFFASHGILDVKSVMTDNGSAYKSKAWRLALEEHEIEHFRTAPHTPKTNGKVERFNQTMQEEWLRVTGYTSEMERRAALIPFLNDYNHDRPHQSIGNRPPIHRAPAPGQRLVASAPIVLPPKPPISGQLSLDMWGEPGA